MNLNKVVFRFVSISFSILVILLVLIGFVKIGTYCYDFGYRVFTEAPVDAEPGRDVIVQISDDMSDMDIAKELKEKGLVENAKLFFVQLKVSAYSGRLHSGVYTLNTSMTARDMMVLMLILLILYGTVHLCRTCYDYGYRFFAEKQMVPDTQDVESTEAQ